jgi:hypothetical protein
MKKIIIIIFIGLLLFNSLTLVVTPNKIDDKKIFHDTILISKPIINDIGEFVSIKGENYNSLIYEPGNPSLPIITKTYYFPLGTNILNIDIFSEKYELFLEKKILPSPNPIINSNEINFKSLNLNFNKNVYESSDFYPSEKFLISKGAGLNNEENVLILNIKINSQYSPKNNILICPKNVSIEIEYTLPQKSIIKSNDFDMVIVTPERFSSDLQSLIDHKNNIGIKTFLKTTEKIYEEYFGIDEPEKIKYFIKDSAENLGISYVLFIGDVNYFPIRKTSIKMDLPIDDAITDLYYSDIYDADGNFCSWDSNGNGIFGEFKPENYMPSGDIIDMYPDIMTGRIPCSNSDQLSIIINKIITYETETYNAPWFNKLILMAGDTFPYDDKNEGEIVTNIIADYMEKFGYITEKLFTSLDTFKPRIINEKISDGAGFVSYSGHGYEQGFGTSPPQRDKRIEYYSPYLIGMENNNKLPIIFLDACSTTKLDFSINDLKEWYPLPFVILLSYLNDIQYNPNNLYPCFSWELLKKHNGGSIATMGSTRVAFLGMSNEGEVVGGIAFLNIKFFEAYEPGINLGILFNSAVNSYINNAGWREPITPQEFILLGDPSLKIGGYNI